VQNQPSSPLRHTFGANRQRSNTPVLGQLPFTGFGLLLSVVLGLILVATGVGIRARARA
jgi:hypothetical protein